jgi:hypothetical protein
VRLEEMVARAAAETEAMARAEKEGRVAAVDKTLPVPPIPSGKLSHYGVNRRIVAQDIFHQSGPEQETGGDADTEAGTDVVPRTPSLSALSLLRPPPRRDGLAFLSYGEQGNEETGLDALERRLVEQVGTRKPPTLHPPDVRSVLDLMSSPGPPPPPVPGPVPVPGKSMAQEQEDDVGVGGTMNESAISSLALAAEEDFGGRKAQDSKPVLHLDAECEAEDEAEGEDADADGRTQCQGKGTGAGPTKRAPAGRPSPIRKRGTGTNAEKGSQRRRKRTNASRGMTRPRVSGVRRRAASRNG